MSKRSFVRKISWMAAFLISFVSFGSNFAFADAPPEFTLSSSGGNASVREPFVGYTITSTGGAIQSWSISPALDNGLSFDTSSGLIFGTPTNSSQFTVYTISAHNAFGDASQNYSIFTYGPLIDAQSSNTTRAQFGSQITIHGRNLDVVNNVSLSYTDSVTQDSYSWYTTSIVSQSNSELTFILPAQNRFLERPGGSRRGAISNATAPTGVSWHVTARQALSLNAQNQSEVDVQLYDVLPAPQIVDLPDPVQKSLIEGITPKIGTVGTSVSVTATGSFIEKVSSIHINGISITEGSWNQTESTLSFTFIPVQSGVNSIQIFNGSIPLLAPQIITVGTGPTAPKPASLDRHRNIYLRCVKGAKTRVVYGFDPRCPAGFSKP